MWPWDKVEWRLKMYIDGLQDAIAAQAEENSRIDWLVNKVQAQELALRKAQERIDTLEFQAAEGAFATTMSKAQATLARPKRNRKASGANGK